MQNITIFPQVNKIWGIIWQLSGQWCFPSKPASEHFTASILAVASDLEKLNYCVIIFEVYQPLQVFQYHLICLLPISLTLGCSRIYSAQIAMWNYQRGIWVPNMFSKKHNLLRGQWIVPRTSHAEPHLHTHGNIRNPVQATLYSYFSIPCSTAKIWVCGPTSLFMSLPILSILKPPETTLYVGIHRLNSVVPCGLDFDPYPGPRIHLRCIQS